MCSLLIEKIENLKKSEIKQTIDNRIREFKELGKKPSNEIFNELCFCILTANFNAERSIKMQNELSSGFCDLSEQRLIENLKALGHRFPKTRGKYIVEARKHKGSLKDRIKSFKQEPELRDWFVKNVKGIGYKEASHFLRNIGFMNLAIVDFHIVDVLVKHGLIERPKTLTPKKYLEIEDVLKSIARKTNLTLAELDLYLWYMETGRILK